MTVTLRAIVFDLDGTLIDSLGDIAVAANHALTRHGRDALDAKEIAGYVGDGARSLMARAARLPENAPELEELLASFVEYYTAHATVHTKLAAGARAALEALAPEYALALLTNKPRRTTEAVLEGLGLARFFRAVVAGGDLPEKKPDPAPLVHIAERLVLSPGELVMVGDGPQDIECARAAGTRSIGVLGGILPEARLTAARPDVIVENLERVPDAVRELARAAQATSK